MKNLTLLFLVLFVQFTASAQNSKLDQALKGFLESPFMKEVKKFKNDLQKVAREVKYSKDFSETEKKNISKGYDKCVNAYNEFLLQLKTDITDVAMLKFIIKNPERYAKIIKSDMHDIKEISTYEFQNRILDTKFGSTSTVFGSPAFIPIIIEIIGITKQVIVWIRELKKVSEETVEKFLVEPFKLDSWDDL